MRTQSRPMQRDCKGKMKGVWMEPDNLRRGTIHIRHLSDVPVSRNRYKTVSNLYDRCLIGMIQRLRF